MPATLFVVYTHDSAKARRFVGNEVLDASGTRVCGYATFPSITQGVKRTEAEAGVAVDWLEARGHSASYVRAPK